MEKRPVVSGTSVPERAVGLGAYVYLFDLAQEDGLEVVSPKKKLYAVLLFSGGHKCVMARK
jgi:hypothetical protein